MSLLMAAAGLILSGRTEAVLTVHAEKLGTPPVPGMSEKEFADMVRNIFAVAGIYSDWEVPYGYNFNAIGALVTQRYMYETGTPIEYIASVIVSLRKWAVRNPNALLQRELTVEDVLKSKMVSYPLTSRMCNIVCDAAHALIITSAKKLSSW
ncbi:MAG: hypothetical protein QXH24_02635 [Candidatus Bathyarchaeia archaeon]